MDLYLSAIVSGIAVGGTYALIAIGITHVFNVTRVLNFAHAGFVLWGANIYTELTFEQGWPVGLAAVVTVLAVTAMGLAAETLFMRFAGRATPAKRAVMTFGLLTVLLALSVRIYEQEPRAAVRLMPDGGLELFDTRITWQQLTNLVTVVIVVLGMGAFLRLTRRGLLTRAMAEDETITQLLGVSRSGVALMNWGIASAIGGLAGVLIASLRIFVVGEFVFLFLVALIASLVGGLQSLTLAALGGIAIGIIQNVTPVAWSAVGAGEVAVFAAVVVLVLLRRAWPSEVSELSWSKPEVDDGSRAWLLGRIAVAAGWAALFLAVVNDDVWGTTAVRILMFTLAALSFVPLAGWTGQISLGHGGLMAIGAYTLGEAYVYHGLPFGVSLVIVVAVGAVAGAFLGVLTLRLGFVQTAVVTLAFASVVVSWLLPSSVFHTTAGQLSVFSPTYLDTGRSLFGGLAVVILVVVALLWNLRRSQWGTAMLATRTNPNMVRHFGISPGRARLTAFAVSGSIAALAGVAMILLVSITGPGTFGLSLSLTVLLYATVGGTGAIVGPLIGPLLLLGLPEALDLSSNGDTTTSDIIAGIAIVYLMMTRWDGLAGILKRPAAASASGGHASPRSGMRTLLGVRHGDGSHEAEGWAGVGGRSRAGAPGPEAAADAASSLPGAIEGVGGRP